MRVADRGFRIAGCGSRNEPPSESLGPGHCECGEASARGPASRRSRHWIARGAGNECERKWHRVPYLVSGAEGHFFLFDFVRPERPATSGAGSVEVLRKNIGQNEL